MMMMMVMMMMVMMTANVMDMSGTAFKRLFLDLKVFFFQDLIWIFSPSWSYISRES